MANLNMVIVPNVGALLSVLHMEKSGLKIVEGPVPFMVRNDTSRLFAQLNLNRNCFIRGPPGTGKSSSVWFWLLTHLHDHPGRVGKWVHFGRLETTSIAIRFVDGAFAFTDIDEVSLPDDVSLLVVDGVRQSNSDKAREVSHTAFKKRIKVVWVTSQQVSVGGEDLAASRMDLLNHYSWTEGEASSFLSLLPQNIQDQLRTDMNQALASTFATAAEALAAKFFHFGGSARWLFSMNFAEAYQDLSFYADSIANADLVHRGLMGERSNLAMNHITAEYPPGLGVWTLPKYEIASKFLVKLIALKVGVSAIVAMYNSKWVRSNPSVRGFVFEWDVLAQAEHRKSIQVKNNSSVHLESWNCDSFITLEQFLTLSPQRDTGIMVEAPVWNYPEVDGLYLTIQNNAMHLIAWNASIATTHSGHVHNLQVLLENLAQRPTNPLYFQSVRFAFIVPMETLPHFKAPNSTAAKKSLSAWSFDTFEVYGMEPSSASP